MRLFLIVAVAASLLAPELGAQQTGAAYMDKVFAKGETLDFGLSWLRINGGSARMTVTPMANDRVRIYSLAASNAFFSSFFRVRDEIESIVDRDTFSTLIFRKTLNEGRHSKQELTVIDSSGKFAIRMGKRIPVPRPVLDPLSTIFYLRRFDLTVGKSVSFTILADGKVYELVADVLKQETIATAAGLFETIVVEPKMKSGGIFRDENNRLVIWFTNDDRKIPVQIRSEIAAGSITATLKNYKLGSP